MVRARMARIGAGAAAASLIALHLLTAWATAAVPGAEVSVQATPPAFSAGNAAGFRAAWTLKGNNLSKLFLTIESTGATAASYLATTKNGVAVNACSTALPVTCSFGGQRKNDRIDVVVGFTAAAASSVSARFVWSSSGNTSSDGGSSHGDFWIAGPASAAFSSDRNFAGGFLATAGGQIANDQSLSGANKQAAKLQNLPATIAATLRDGPGVTFPCSDMPSVSLAGAASRSVAGAPRGHQPPQPSGFRCSSLFGEWVDVRVGDGQAFGSPFQLLVKYSSGTPKGFLHVLDGGGQELIKACAGGSPAAPCFTWNGAQKTATVWLLQNGGMRGFG